jgi:hypothetical protein
MSQFYDKTIVTFHNGNAFEADGVTPEPFATFTCNCLIDRKLIDGISKLIRKHMNDTHLDFCNIKISTEDWDV